MNAQPDDLDPNALPDALAEGWGSTPRRSNTPPLLIDWNTVALAPPERDLWMVVGDEPTDATA